ALLLGLFALYARLARAQAGGLALAGLVLGVTSLGLLLSADGVFVLTAAALGVLVLDGEASAADVIAKVSGGDFTWPVLVVFLSAVVLALAAGVAIAGALWRSGIVPRWAAILLGTGLVLFATSTPL